MSQDTLYTCDWCGATAVSKDQHADGWATYYTVQKPEDIDAALKAEDICPDCNEQVKSLRQIIQQPSKAYSQPVK